MHIVYKSVVSLLIYELCTGSPHGIYFFLRVLTKKKLKAAGLVHRQDRNSGRDGRGEELASLV